MIYIKNKKGIIISVPKILATGFGVGYLPIIPGTFGTFLGVVIYYLLPTKSFVVYFIIVIFATVISILICEKAEKIFKKRDDQRIVLDEIIGFFVSMVFIQKSFEYIVFGFILFRFFDIIKFPFIKKIHDLPGGLGIVCDDILAGIITNIILHFIFLFRRIYFTP